MVAERKKSAATPASGKLSPSRVIIDQVSPNLENGRFAAKTALGHGLPVEAVIICDGHEVLKADLLWRFAGDEAWRRTPMVAKGNDVYAAMVRPEKLGAYQYTVEACIDRFAGWRDGFLKKVAAGEAKDLDVQAGLALLKDAKIFKGYAEKNKNLGAVDAPALKDILNFPSLVKAHRDDWDDPSRVRFAPELPLAVDPDYASFSAWYEFFPRSRWIDIAEGGNLKDAANRLDYVADLGFDICYLPPIHPIGVAFRKGRNNSLIPTADDVGSPWAIGGKEGGHKAIHPALGTFADFAALIKKARDLNVEVALDIAFQCSPDHPYVKEHPEWFRHRADGTIQYAENPPKKYQDIYPFDFECEAWESLWQELKSIFSFWIDKGVRVFRIDNPHTKAFAFWEWCIGEIRRDHPEVIFLAEAFTRPHIMAYLAKIGFSQSYTYFAWRHEKEELEEYLTELTRSGLKDYMRPNFWPNTPDILTETLQNGGRPAHVQRLILAATMTASYGIYGPVFELMESAPWMAGKEEYLNSEKYEAREWNVKASHSLAPLIKRINRIRRGNPALQTNRTLKFHPTSNEHLIAYTKEAEDGSNLILTVVNLDRNRRQSGLIDLQIHTLGLPQEGTYDLHDLLSDARYAWRGWKNFVDLDPYAMPAHIFRIDRTARLQDMRDAGR